MRTLRDAVYGLAVGDAMGVPYEFKLRDSFAVVDEMIGNGSHRQPAGTFSDDTSMTLATCASISECGGIDVDDMRNRFEDWAWSGRYAIDGVVFDIGATVSRALDERRGQSDEYDNGNGSIMRIIPLAFTEASDEDIVAVSSITHANDVSTSTCVRYIGIARMLIDGIELPEVLRSVEPGIFDMVRSDVKSGGYVVDTYTSALWCLANNDNYADTILEAICLGGDTDTTAAVAGALAGIAYGVEGIPYSWMHDLRGRDIIDSVL